MLFSVTNACIYKYGEAPGKIAKYTYAHYGADWTGGCKSGREQSPINVVRTEGSQWGTVPFSRRTIIDLGQIRAKDRNVQVINTGHTIQVEWKDDNWTPNLTVALTNNASILTDSISYMEATNDTKRVKATPLQFHFHTASEHLVHGHMYPLEMHVVSRVGPTDVAGCKNGCFTVVGIMFEMSPDLSYKNPNLVDLWEVMPEKQDSIGYLPDGKTVNLNAFLPTNLSYVTYKGSLTTPPCSEGILWHLLLNPVKIGFEQWQAFLRATGSNNCTEIPTVEAADGQAATNASYTCTKLTDGSNSRVIQPLNSRSVYLYKEGGDNGAAGLQLSILFVMLISLVQILMM